MDWPQDNACLGDRDADLETVFKYEARPARVIKVVSSNDYRAEVWSLKTHKDWQTWLSQQEDETGEGLILILANRFDSGSSDCIPHRPMSLEEWLATADVKRLYKDGNRRETTFAPLGALPSPGTTEGENAPPVLLHPRSLRHLPFEQRTFRQICERFQIHTSFVRTLTRSDVPAFSCNDIEMGEEHASVYNCRTSNAWELDLALSATHFPQRAITFAVIYGSTNAIEKQIMERLRSVKGEAAHPLLLPGMLTELELARHIRLVESSINEVESKIFDLDFATTRADEFSRSEIEMRSVSKRTAWLDLSYLRNSLVTWNEQLLRMVEHAVALNRERYSEFVAESVASTRSPSVIDGENQIFEGDQKLAKEHTVEKEVAKPVKTETMSIMLASMGSTFDDQVLPVYHENKSEPSESGDSTTTIVMVEDARKVPSESGESHRTLCLTESARRKDAKRMYRIGEKIKTRLAAIRDEYDEKIRDCTMRVDGMAMATQWAQSETAVEIAVATNRDSAVMRSISLVTMIFLPGTFFATVFSMTFFNWSADSGTERVSSYLWIYVVVTLFFTAITIGLWYFFVMFRRKGLRKSDQEKT